MLILATNKQDAPVHLPHHPVWFWLIVVSPWIGFVALWVTVNTVKKSFKPWIPWLFSGYAIFLFCYLVLGPFDGHKTARLVLGTGMWTLYTAALWLKRRYQFEIMESPRGRWYFWARAEFSVPDDTHILVRNLKSVSPWYAEKLGLRKTTAPESHDSDSVKFKFKEDGKSVVLTTRSGFQTGKTPIFFTRKIEKMRRIMVERGINVPAIEKDRQGISYFQIRDPEGNEIEIVQEP
jgi:predicted enzyme related to lactoylglutathione lyase